MMVEPLYGHQIDTMRTTLLFMKEIKHYMAIMLQPILNNSRLSLFLTMIMSISQRNLVEGCFMTWKEVGYLTKHFQQLIQGHQ